MEKILEKGDDFVKSETERVTKLRNSKVSADKKKERTRSPTEHTPDIPAV